MGRVELMGSCRKKNFTLLSDWLCSGSGLGNPAGIGESYGQACGVKESPSEFWYFGVDMFEGGTDL